MPKWWNESRILNVMRARCCRLAFALGLPGRHIALHLGCGNVRKQGFVNIDVVRTHATDYVCDILVLPLTTGSVRRVEMYHVIEHLTRDDATRLLEKLHLALEDRGILVMELPDFDRVVREYLSGDESRLFNIFGRQRRIGDTHQFGYNPVRLCSLLSNLGYKNISIQAATDNHKESEPCFRVECEK
jgi:hypothetical protein